MHKTIAQTSQFLSDFLDLAGGLAPDVDIVVCPPFTALAAASIALEGQSRVALGAQNMHWEEAGAFTGEISAPMLRELGVKYVLLGHSERRAFAGESDSNVALKVRCALCHQLTPIVAVGETLPEHLEGRAIERVTLQAQTAFAGLDDEAIGACLVAYEPIWAIGTGKADDPVNADTVMGAIRDCVPALRRTRILYGGSVKPDNMEALCRMPNIDGGLVGGASLQAESFAAIVNAAGKVKSSA